jgi:hypothetical protein
LNDQIAMAAISPFAMGSKANEVMGSIMHQC